MSTFRACGITGRVVLVHEMHDRTVISELEQAEAGALILQLQSAVQEGFGALPQAAAAAPLI